MNKNFCLARRITHRTKTKRNVIMEIYSRRKITNPVVLKSPGKLNKISTGIQKINKILLTRFLITQEYYAILVNTIKTQFTVGGKQVKSYINLDVKFFLVTFIHTHNYVSYSIHTLPTLQVNYRKESKLTVCTETILPLHFSG